MALTKNTTESGRDASSDRLTTRDAAVASARELRTFLTGLRGKKPHEMLGQVAQSGLVQATIAATIGTVIFMVVFTALPYYWYRNAPKPATAIAKPAAKVEAAPAPSAPAAVAADKNEGSAASAQKTLEKLGESETKTADPNVNPLESGLDDILDGKK